MRRMPLLIVTLAVAIMTGCATNKPVADGESRSPSVAPADVAVSSARIFIDGQDRGTTPSTVNVRRGFGETRVSLHVGKELVRVYEIERVQSSNSNDLIFSFRGDNTDGTTTFDASDLNQTKDGTYIIPYFASRIRVEDRQYGLTLLIGE